MESNKRTFPFAPALQFWLNASGAATSEHFQPFRVRPKGARGGTKADPSAPSSARRKARFGARNALALVRGPLERRGAARRHGVACAGRPRPECVGLEQDGRRYHTRSRDRPVQVSEKDYQQPPTLSRKPTTVAAEVRQEKQAIRSTTFVRVREPELAGWGPQKATRRERGQVPSRNVCRQAAGNVRWNRPATGSGSQAWRANAPGLGVGEPDSASIFAASIFSAALDPRRER